MINWRAGNGLCFPPSLCKANGIGRLSLAPLKSYPPSSAYGQGQSGPGQSILWLELNIYSIFEEGYFNIAPAGSSSRAVTSATMETN